MAEVKKLSLQDIESQAKELCQQGLQEVQTRGAAYMSGVVRDTPFLKTVRGKRDYIKFLKGAEAKYKELRDGLPSEAPSDGQERENYSKAWVAVDRLMVNLQQLETLALGDIATRESVRRAAGDAGKIDEVYKNNSRDTLSVILNAEGYAHAPDSYYRETMWWQRPGIQAKLKVLEMLRADHARDEPVETTIQPTEAYDQTGKTQVIEAKPAVDTRYEGKTTIEPGTAAASQKPVKPLEPTPITTSEGQHGLDDHATEYLEEILREMGVGSKDRDAGNKNKRGFWHR